MPPLSIGVQLPEVERDVRWPELRAMAKAAEEVGFDSIWLGDHHLYRGDGRPERGPWDAWTTLAALAATKFRSPEMKSLASAVVVHRALAVVTLVAAAWLAGLLATAAQAQLVVERVARFSGGERAGIRRDDVLFSWESTRGTARGELTTPFDLLAPEEEHAAVGEGDLARSRWAAAADQAGRRDRVVRRSERPRRQRSVGAWPPRDAGDLGHLDRLAAGERRQDRREPSRG